MKISGASLFIFFALIIFAKSAASSTELEERNEVRVQSQRAYETNDFVSLNRQFNLYIDYRNQRTSSGASKLNLFFDGIESALKKLDASGIQEKITLTEKWASTNSDSFLANQLYADALLAYGMYFRGTGYATTVSPEAWNILKEFTERSTKVMLGAKGLAKGSAQWQRSMIKLARFNGATEESVKQLFDSGLKENPFNYLLYGYTLEYYLPKWHGTPAALDKFIKYAVRNSPSEYGEELYARLYSAVEESQYPRTIYTVSLVDWKRMKVGLDLWIKRFPTSWNKNIYAYHACIAGDKKTLRTLFTEIDNDIELVIWSPNAQSTLGKCVNFASL